MGLFSSSKTITVSSTLYNMAGDENDRPNFLKGTLFGAVMADSPSLSDDITTAYFEGPGLKQRQFFRWAVRNDMPGLPTTEMSSTLQIPAADVAPFIPVSASPPAPVGLQMNVSNAEVSDGDFGDWIQRWILENHPTRINEDWIGEYDEVNDLFSVEFPNLDFFSWANDIAPVFDKDKRYLVARYTETVGSETQAPAVEGTPTVGALVLPDLTGFVEQSSTGSVISTELVRTRTTIYSYDNGDPDFTFEDAVPANSFQDRNTSVDIHWKDTVTSASGLILEGQREIWNITGTDTVAGGYSDVVVTTTDMGGGVTRTETSTTTGEQIVPSWTTRLDTQDIFIGSIYGNERIFIYEIGSGNATLDALDVPVDASTMQEFFPFLPVRIKNKSITEPEFSDEYAVLSKGYKKAFQGKKLSGLVDKVEENEDIDDVDYAYVMFGVSLNVKENACKKYLWNFFDKMRTFQLSGSGDAMSNIVTQTGAYNTALGELDAWTATDWSGTDWGDVPARPVVPSLTAPPTTQIRILNEEFNYDIRISWVHIDVETFTGVWTGADGPLKKGDVELVKGPSFTWNERVSFDTPTLVGEEWQDQKKIPSIYIRWQNTNGTYQRMQIFGLIHQNAVYKGKKVRIDSDEALDDTEESGFVIPLHYPTISEMSIVEYTQMSTANSHILFNSYEVTKQRWYQKGIFKILLVLLIVIAAVIIFPGAFAAGSGILGANAAIGGALGLTGTAAIVAGVVANYIAAIIISEVLKAVGIELLGEKWGALFAAIVGFALTASLSGVNLLSAEGLLSLGGALANGYSGWVQGDIAEMAEELEAERETYEARFQEIQDLIDGLGGNDLNFNPLFLTDGVKGNGQRRGSRGYTPETSEEFIRRTTMTGTDIVDLTKSMVYDFVDLQKTLPRN